jgi:hypothetical protein
MCFASCDISVIDEDIHILVVITTSSEDQLKTLLLDEMSKTQG